MDGGATQTVSYGYDANDALDSLTYPSGHTVSYRPDAFGRPRAVLPHVVSVNYHPNGMPSDMQYANGVISTMSLNPRQWPGHLSFKRPNNGGGFINSTFSYDLVGNLTKIMDTTYSTLPRIYKYDFVDRLVYDADVADLREYFYDGSGNMTFMGKYYAGNQAYTYDTAGRLDSVVGSTLRNYAYDSAGNVSFDGYYSFGHDRANNMRCIQCNAATPMLHTYDGSNMRVKSVFGADSRQYMHNHQGLLLQTVNPGVEFTEHIYLGRRQVASRRVVN